MRLLQLVDSVAAPSYLRPLHYYTNGRAIRQLVDKPKGDITDKSKIKWGSVDKKQTFSASAGSFVKWVNTKPKDLPEVVYASEIDPNHGLYLPEPVECVWENGIWINLTDPKFFVKCLGLTAVGGPIYFVSSRRDEVATWILGVSSMARMSRSFFSFQKWGKTF
ncbi:MAG: hypothetical protein MJA29_11575 [Candidatus Omnitrophica bacterium]|nr:hypothetical protein [Candidatus Omnitrophota bacterium]